MARTRYALVPRHRAMANPQGSNWLILVIGAGILIWLVLRNRQAAAPVASYKNEEVWDIEWSSDGLPVKVKISRKAVQT